MLFNLKKLFTATPGSDAPSNLNQELIATKKQLAQSLRERDEARQELLKWTSRGVPEFDADGLAVWGKNPAFLRDPRFQAAYKAGIHSGHIFTKIPEDLHVEWRVAIVLWAARHALHLEGDFVECGVNTGILGLAICRYIDFNTTGKSYYLFDTFKGLPLEQLTGTEKVREEQHFHTELYYDCWDTVVKNFAPYPRARLVRGKVPDTLSEVDIGKVCYLSIDMNIAYPERAAMEHFWPKLVSGAIVILDDYGWAPYHEQKATLDEFAANNNVEIFTLPTGQGLLIKP